MKEYAAAGGRGQRDSRPYGDPILVRAQLTPDSCRLKSLSVTHLRGLNAGVVDRPAYPPPKSARVPSPHSCPAACRN